MVFHNKQPSGEGFGINNIGDKNARLSTFRYLHILIRLIEVILSDTLFEALQQVPLIIQHILKWQQDIVTECGDNNGRHAKIQRYNHMFALATLLRLFNHEMQTDVKRLYLVALLRLFCKGIHS